MVPYLPGFDSEHAALGHWNERKSPQSIYSRRWLAKHMRVVRRRVSRNAARVLYVSLIQFLIDLETSAVRLRDSLRQFWVSPPSWMDPEIQNFGLSSLNDGMSLFELKCQIGELAGGDDAPFPLPRFHFEPDRKIRCRPVWETRRRRREKKRGLQ